MDVDALSTGEPVSTAPPPSGGPSFSEIQAASNRLVQDPTFQAFSTAMLIGASTVATAGGALPIEFLAGGAFGLGASQVASYLQTGKPLPLSQIGPSFATGEILAGAGYVAQATIPIGLGRVAAQAGIGAVAGYGLSGGDPEMALRGAVLGGGFSLASEVYSGTLFGGVAGRGEDVGVTIMKGKLWRGFPAEPEGGPALNLPTLISKGGEARIIGGFAKDVSLMHDVGEVSSSASASQMAVLLGGQQQALKMTPLASLASHSEYVGGVVSTLGMLGPSAFPFGRLAPLGKQRSRTELVEYMTYTPESWAEVAPQSRSSLKAQLESTPASQQAMRQQLDSFSATLNEQIPYMGLRGELYEKQIPQLRSMGLPSMRSLERPALGIISLEALTPVSRQIPMQLEKQMPMQVMVQRSLLESKQQQSFAFMFRRPMKMKGLGGMGGWFPRRWPVASPSEYLRISQFNNIGLPKRRRK